MLKIKVVTSTHKIVMEGHADYAEKGKDIVCSAASILLYTLADTLSKYKAILWEKPKIHIDDENGNIKALLQCVPKPEYKGNIDIVYQTVLNGLQLLAEGYPDNVQLKII